MSRLNTERRSLIYGKYDVGSFDVLVCESAFSMKSFVQLLLILGFSLLAFLPYHVKGQSMEQCGPEQERSFSRSAMFVSNPQDPIQQPFPLSSLGNFTAVIGVNTSTPRAGRIDSVYAVQISSGADSSLYVDYVKGTSKPRPIVGFRSRGKDTEPFVLPIDAWNITIGFLNHFAFEVQRNALVVWKHETGDSLRLDHVWTYGMDTGIGAAYVVEYKQFDDDSIVLVTERATQIYRTVEFWHITRDYELRRLLETNFAKWKEENRVERGYRFSDTFQDTPIVHVTAKKDTSVGGVWGKMTILDLEAEPTDINLWNCVREGN